MFSKQAVFLIAKHPLNDTVLYWHHNGYWQSDVHAAVQFTNAEAAAEALSLAKTMSAYIIGPTLRNVHQDTKARGNNLTAEGSPRHQRPIQQPTDEATHPAFSISI